MVSVTNGRGKRRGFVLTYSLIAMFVCMLLITLLVQATYVYRSETESRIGETGAILALQGGIDLVESELNSWYCDTYEGTNVNNISEISEAFAVLLTESFTGLECVPNSSYAKGRTYLLFEQNVYGAMTNGVWVSDSNGADVRVYFSTADISQLRNNSILTFLVVGDGRNNGKTVYKLAVVQARIKATKKGVVGDIQNIGLEVLSYTETLEGGIEKWGNVN